MSRIATDWAWSLNIKPASLKLLLLSMADRADEYNCCYPSIKRLVKDTGLNDKTVQGGILKLVEKGILKDTGERKGPTMRVRVFCLVGIDSDKKDYPNHHKNGVVTKPSLKPSNDTENGNVTEIGNVTENGMLNDPENGMLNDPENGVQNHPLEPPIEPATTTRANPDVVRSILETPTQPLAPSNLFDTSTPDQPKNFMMHVDWQPTANLAEMCRFNQVDLSAMDEDEQSDILREFITYWITNGSRPAAQGEWERKFMANLKRLQVRKTEDVPTRQTARAEVTAAVMDINDLDWMRPNSQHVTSKKQNKRAAVTKAVMDVGDTNW